MKTSQVFVSLIKIGFIVAFLAIIAKGGLAWYYGYRNINATYGATYFYTWRTKYVDPKLAKSFYARNNLNEQKENKVFFKYLDNVQGKTIHHAESYDYKSQKYTYGPLRQNFPYYAYGFPDSFVYGTKKSWHLFEKDPKYLDLEFKYLELRAKFIEELYDIKFSINSEYFHGKKAGQFLKKGSFFSKVDIEKVYEFFNKNRSLIDIVDVLTIISNIKNNKPKYFVEITKDSAKMTPDLENDVMKVVNRVFSGFNITTAKVNEFFFRVAVVKIKPTDAHILNRIYTYLQMVFAYVDVDNEDIKLYNSYKKSSAELDKELQKGGLKEDKVNLKKRRAGNFKRKMNILRSEAVYTKVSQYIGTLLGEKDFILDPKDDKRSFLEKLGSPKTSKPKDFKKDKVLWKGNKKLLDKEVSKMLKKFISA